MSSQIKSVYTALANMDVTIDSAVVDVKKPNELPNSINTAILPVRLLTPIQQFTPGILRSEGWNGALGSTVIQLNWSITDIFLYSTVAQNIGIKALADPLVDYCVAYVDALNNTLSIPSNLMISNYQIRPDIINYPLGGATFFYGVYVYLNLLEKM